MADTDTIDSTADDQPIPPPPPPPDNGMTVDGQPGLDSRSATQIDPAAAMQQMAAAASQAQPMADPNYIEAAGAAVHHGRLAQTLHNVIDTIGTVLGGPQTVHITKNQDGTMSVTHDASTMGEKWARVAQAAMGGLAQGFAAGPGPGGIARAAAGGIQAGMQMPQQQEQQAQQEATAQNKQLVDRANIARLNQEVVRGAFNNDHLDRDDKQRQSELALQHSKELTDQGFTPLLMNVKDPKTIAQYGAANPDKVGAHMGANGEMIFNEPDGNGGVNFYHLDSNSVNAPITKAIQTELRKVDPTDASKTVTVPITIPVGTKRGDVAAKLMAITAANDTAIKTANDIGDKNSKKTALELETELNDPNTTPARKAQIAATLAADKKRETDLKVAGRAVTNIGAGYTPSAAAVGTTPSGAPVIGKQWGGGDPNSAFERVAQMLQQGKMALSQVRQMRGKGNAQQQDFLGRADQIDRENGGTGLNPTLQEERYKARQKTETGYAPTGEAGQTIGSFSALLEHLGDMSDNADELRRTRSPWLNKPINDLDKSIAGGEKVGPAELRTSAPAHEFANVLNNNHALNNDEKTAAAKSLNAAMTPAQLQANGKQMAKTAIERLAPIFQGYRTTMNGEESPTQLTPRAVQTLHSLGLYDYYMKEAHGTPAAGGGTQQLDQSNPPPMSKLPLGHDTTFGNGQVWRNANGQPLRIK